MSHCKCVFPSPTEEELITISGAEPGTEFRLLAETSPEGYVRIQQLAHGEGIGWYVQKTLVLPRDVLAVMLPQLRKAQCLMAPKSSPPATAETVPYLRLTPSDDVEPTTERRVS